MKIENTEQFQGIWEIGTTDNFDEYLKAVGVGFALRKVAGFAKPTQKISVEDSVWTIVTTTSFKTMTLTFRLGEEFEETTGDGRDVKSIITIENGVMKHVQKGKGAGTILREITEGGKSVKMTLKCDIPDVTCIRTYKRVD